MYVCLCNALTDRDVRDAQGRGARSAAAVYRAHGCAPRCGKCVPMVREMVAGDGATAGGGGGERQPVARTG